MTVPLLVVFSIGLTVLKSKEVLPKPVTFWTKSHQHTLLALFFVFSVAWALELVTHFEELAFWLFLLDQGPAKREWFDSWEYRMWYISCIAAVLGMPLTALIARNDLSTMDAWILLVGSSGSTFTNVAFVYVLARFPAFLRHVKAEGAEPEVVVRLSSFYEYNLLRVCFRFMAALPFFILAVDGIKGSHPINSNPFWSDFLLVIAAIGQFVSSAITLMIFFPRSFAAEAGYRPKPPSIAPGSVNSYTYSEPQSYPNPNTDPTSPSIVSSPKSPAHPATARPTPLPGTGFAHHRRAQSAHSSSEVDVADDESNAGSEEPAPRYHESDHESPRSSYSYGSATLSPRRESARTWRQGSASRYAHATVTMVPRETGTSAETRRLSAPALHPYVTTFTSPIDLIQISQDSGNAYAP
ncbi:hypothetical protein EW146_g2637 [Bondarzewia mesenterica]|uniref:Uncharacterized protein n=1 Tax=Bondarzewia mesenterica TaxID=1095465 RepID=A0A4S4LZY8_9AGAM|nr:hypothetical protein EW146_g2637 [Bondarzewia mesenterica]